MDIALKTRITKIFAMLGSEHAGERDNASVMLNKIAKEQKLTLTELLAQANTASTQSSYKSPFGSRARDTGPSQAERDRERANYEARARETYRQQQEAYKKAREEAAAREREAKATAEKAARPPMHGRNLLDTLAKVEGNLELAARILTNWELDFAQDVAARYSADDDLSDRQLVYVNRVVAKMKRHFK